MRIPFKQSADKSEINHTKAPKRYTEVLSMFWHALRASASTALQVSLSLYCTYKFEHNLEKVSPELI